VSVGRTETALGAFYRRLSSRVGKAKAITATARKIAVLFYNAMRHGMDYVDPGASYILRDPLPRACRQKSSPPRQSPGLHHASRRRADGCAGCFLGTFERVIASGNHLLTQVKDNQPSLRRRLDLGTAGRKPTGSDKSQTAGRNRWETR